MSGFGVQANSMNFEQLCAEIAATREVAPEDAHFFCTFNAAAYTSEQVFYVAEHFLPQLKAAGLTGIIVSGPALAGAAAEAGLSVVASTMCSIYNEALARFYWESGFRRVILPRDLTLDEIEAICAAVPELEYEVFLMRNGCPFADSHCLGLHRAERPSMCRTLRESEWWEVLSGGNFELADGRDYLGARMESAALHKECFHVNTCGLCALWRMERAGVNAYKVVGRSDALDDLCFDVALTERNILLARECATEAEFLARMERPRDMDSHCAQAGLSCYYPEVRF